MAFDPSNLSALSYANGFTLWHYRTRDDLLEVVRAPGYFKPAASMLRPGDVVFVNAKFDENDSFFVHKLNLEKSG